MSGATVTHGLAADEPTCPVCVHCITEGWTGMTASHCRICGREWGPNGNEQHCTTCHRNFSTVAVADKHRDPKGCLDPETVTDRKGRAVFGWRDSDRGRTYTGPALDHNPWATSEQAS